MLEMSKNVLRAVSFDASLFRKELYKAISRLRHEELAKLKQWCQDNFGYLYDTEITEAFAI